MTFWGAYKSFWKNYFNFSGVATRKDFWFVVLWNVIIGGVIGFLLGISVAGIFASDFSSGEEIMARSIAVIVPIFILYFYILASIIPSISLIFRRFHDVGLSGWWYVGLYLANLLIPSCLIIWCGWLGILVFFAINIAILVIFILPTDYFRKSNELIDE